MHCRGRPRPQVRLSCSPLRPQTPVAPAIPPWHRQAHSPRKVPRRNHPTKVTVTNPSGPVTCPHREGGDGDGISGAVHPSPCSLVTMPLAGRIRVSVSPSEATTAARGDGSAGANSPSPNVGGRARVGSRLSERVRSVVTPLRNPGECDGSRRFGTAKSSPKDVPGWAPTIGSRGRPRASPARRPRRSGAVARAAPSPSRSR